MSSSISYAPTAAFYGTTSRPTSATASSRASSTPTSRPITPSYARPKSATSLHSSFTSTSSSSSSSKAAAKKAAALGSNSESRVQKLFGLAQITQGHAYSSSRLAYIPLELLRVTAEENPAINVLKPGKKHYWSTGSGQNHEMVFKISNACLLGFVKILNKSVSHVEIYVSMHDVASQYVLIQSDLHCPHNKTVMYPTGFLPCRYVKIRCVRGTPCAIYNVSIVGVLERVVWREMGPQMGSMIVEHPEALLLPSKPPLPALAEHTFPSRQSIPEAEMEKKPAILQCVRQ